MALFVESFKIIRVPESITGYEKAECHAEFQLALDKTGDINLMGPELG
jgi:hypothetical protein